MSTTAKTRLPRLPLLIGAMAVAAIAACSTPTSPSAPIELTRVKPAALDSTECRGWVVVNGVLVCGDDL